MLLEDYDKIFVFDTETTGLDYATDFLIDFGAIVYEKNQEGRFKETKEFNYLINHGIEITQLTTELTGITKEMIDKDGLPLETVLKKVAPYIVGNVLLVAYNATFDMNFVIAALRKVFNDNALMLDNDILDPYCIFKDRYKYPHRLENAITVLGVVGENSHRAMDDARATFEVLKALVMDSRFERPDINYVNTQTYNPKYGTSGFILPHVRYIPTKGGKNEILATIKRLGH